MNKDIIAQIQENAAAIAGKFDSSFDNYSENKKLVKELESLLTNIVSLHKSIVPMFKDVKSKTETQGQKMKEVLTGIPIKPAVEKGKESVKESPKPASIDVAPGFVLPNVIPTDNWRKVPPCPLYYNVHTEEFGIRACGLMMVGKIGELYGQSVRKYLDCKRHGPGDDISECNFYHDPAKFPASKDRRGFPNRIRYESPSGVRPINQYNLVAGSLSNLKHDLKFIKPNEACKIKHYAMHWLLVALLAEQASRV